MQILAELPERNRQLINAEMLVPRGIVWDQERNLFHHRGDPVDLLSFSENACHPKLRPFAQWCCSVIGQLKHMNAALEIADLLENAIEKINALNVEEDFDILTSKRLLHKKFIHAAGAIIKTKMQLTIPENLRNIGTSTLKSFINEVFLKQQLLDCWFRVLRKRQLLRMSHPLMNEYLLHEQKMRKLEVVQTSQYTFAIATTYDESVNIFSIRRFLHEERIATSTYLNGAYIKNDLMDDARSAQAFKNQIACIISIGGRINEALVDLVERMQQNYEDIVYHELFLPLEAGNITLHEAILKRLSSYEKNLRKEVLLALNKGITRLSSRQDDFNYAFISLQQMLDEVIIDFRDFQLQPAVLQNLEADRMMLRLISYIKLVRRRKNKIFSLTALEEWEEHSKTLNRIVVDLQKSILKTNKRYCKLHKKKNEIELLMNRESGFLGKLLRLQHFRRNSFEKISKATQKLQHMIYMDVLNMLAQNKEYALHVEQESILLMSRQRGYALCAGSNGIDRLPLMLILPESYRDFEVAAVQAVFPSEKFPEVAGLAAGRKI